MKEELKQKMIGVIGTHSNAFIESIAEKCAQVAIEYYKEREQALSMSGVVWQIESVFCNCDLPALIGNSVTQEVICVKCKRPQKN